MRYLVATLLVLSANTVLADILVPLRTISAREVISAADLAVKNPYWNPRPVERDAIRALLGRAWAGDRPE